MRKCVGLTCHLHHQNHILPLLLCLSTDARGVQADHERLQAQTRQEGQGVPVHGTQLPGGPKVFGLEG